MAKDAKWYASMLRTAHASTTSEKFLFIKAADLLENLAEREWELFDLITAAYHGKQYYFKQDDGTIYSRDSGQYMTFDQAIDEFCGRLSND